MDTRSRILLTGTVQGVGFRPFVFRLASELRLTGWVRNTEAGLELEIEGDPACIDEFLSQLTSARPSHASISQVSRHAIAVERTTGFRILPSASAPDDEASGAAILPDLATCPECLAEIFDPSDRRHAYPFTNCIHCGPRFSIVTARPWDRANTTMQGFRMCRACQDEYEAPDNRRFHAQPNACPACGPQLTWLDQSGSPRDRRSNALERAAREIEAGGIVALKGIGGFLLFADARSPEAIVELRERKCRPSKPFALMMPSITAAREEVEVDEHEARWLASAAAPILILRRRPGSRLPRQLAPGNPNLGVMLPCAPLHHLLMRRLGFPVIATSGNLGNEPICTDNVEATERLRNVADGFLVHDRPIARPVDDSIARLVEGDLMILRRSRGFAPAPIPVPGLKCPVLAAGGDLKNTIAVADHQQVLLSQHFGDLASPESQLAFARHLHDFPRLFDAAPDAIACDPHPGYHSQRRAHEAHLPMIRVQHHHAHASACAAENGLDAEEEHLAVVWDGTGHGDDGTVWGGEFLLCRGAGFRRFAWLRPFPLPGGEKAIRDPRFAALGCLHEAGIPLLESSPLARQLTAEELRIGAALIERGVQAPRTSSAGRLFDAVSALCGLCPASDFEGQAAMALEHAASQDPTLTGYPIDQIPISEGEPIDWAPILRSVVRDLLEGRAGACEISRRFHLALADLITKCAEKAMLPTVSMSGGCFQNVLLLELATDRLRNAGHKPVRNRQVPANDGGLAFGQAVVASRLLSPHNN